MNSFVGALSHLIPPSGVSNATPAQGPARPDGSGGDFLSALKNSLSAQDDTLRFSRHATSRLQDRRIALSDADVGRLSRATDKAAAKGAREALLMMPDANFIVSVPNRTVVTAMPAGETGDTIYTNIDTAVIVGEES